MTAKKTPAAESDNDKHAPSDAHIILGPLVKYAAMGLVLVSVILTTAIMMDRQLNEIDREVAALKAELAAGNPVDITATEAAERPDTSAAMADTAAQAKSTPTPYVSEPAMPDAEDTNPDETSEDDPTAGKAEDDVNTETVEPAASVQQTTAETSVAAPAPAEPASRSTEDDLEPVPAASDVTQAPEGVVENESVDPFVWPIDASVAGHNAYLRQIDLMRLEQYRALQQKQLQHMRERLARQEQRIREMEARFRERYKDRADELRERQQFRESFRADRI